MKKFIIFIICIFLVALTCACTADNTYFVAVEDEDDLLIEPLKKKYKAGEKVTVKVPFYSGIGVYCYLNGESLVPAAIEEGYSYSHSEFYFTMPEGDVTLLLSTSPKFSATVEDKSDLLFEPLKNEYMAGEKVTVKTHILYDAGINVYVNGESLGREEAIEVDGRYSHWEYYFTMPYEDVTITFGIYDGFTE